jgi:hypothetical protein
MPSSPQSVPTVILFDYLTANGTAIPNARVSVVLNSTKPATAISPLVTLALTQWFTTTDPNGYWQFSLPSNTNISPANTYYTVSTPDGSYDVTLGATGPYQSTALGTIINVPVPFAPATTPGPITVSGNLTVTGVLAAASAAITGAFSAGISTISGLLTAAAGFVISGGTGATLNASGDFAGRSVTVSTGSGPYTPVAGASLAVGPREIWLAPPNGVDDTTALQAAQALLVTGTGGILHFQSGVYKISGTLAPASACTWQGVFNATVIQWIGGTNTFMITASPAAGSNILGFNLRSLVLDANNTSGVCPVLLNSWQFGTITDVTIQNVAGSGTAALRMECTAGTSATNDTYGNVIRNLHIKNTPVGVQLAGQLGGSTNTYTTNNRFYGLYIESVSQIGIRFVQWCDSNAFYGTEIALTTNSATGVLLNDSGTPGSDVGVYNCNFYHLSIDTFGLTLCTGVLMNVTKQLIIHGAYFSPVAFGGTPIVDNSGRALSYDIIILQDANNTNNIVHMEKNAINDTGGGSGLGAYANWLVQTSVTTGNAPALSAVGSDAAIVTVINGKGSGGVALAASQANYVLVSPAVGGSTPQLVASGSDAAVNLGLTPKSTGSVLSIGPHQVWGDLSIGVAGTLGRLKTVQTTAPTIGSTGSGVSAASVVAGGSNIFMQVTATLTAVAPGVVIGVVAFNGAPLATAPKTVNVTMAAPTAGVAAPPNVGADTYTTSGFTLRSYGPTTVTTATYTWSIAVSW